MSNLPIKHMTLYKHGVGFFERRGAVNASEITLDFRLSEMNDILKSLTTIDRGGGQVLGIDYATPQTAEELLASTTVRLAKERSLRDLVSSLRGRKVRLLLDQEESVTGRLVGLDEPNDREPLDTTLVSLMVETPQNAAAGVQSFAFKRLRSVEILDERGANDLKYFLDNVLSHETSRQVTVRLSPGEHDLAVSYIAPAPTWRVSYRLVSDEDGKTLLQGWGIFDNKLDEDLEEISLALVAGMPISFVYDLYTPHTPERPFVEEEDRVASGPMEFGAADYDEEEMAPARSPKIAYAMAAPAPAPQMMRSMAADMVTSAAVNVEGEDLGELFQYRIATPVSVRRGNSAMVPIISSWLDAAFKKEPGDKEARSLIYNGDLMPTHPIANLRLRNTSGLTLERGPVTVLAEGEYVGEAILPFTPTGGEMIVPYAVELGVKVREDTGAANQVRSVSVQGEFLFVETWDVNWRSYTAQNTTDRAQSVLIEHLHSVHYETFETPDPAETAGAIERYRLEIPAHGEQSVRVNERRLVSRREEIRRQSLAGLQKLVKDGLVKPMVYDKLAELLSLWEKIEQHNKSLAELNADREKVYRQQTQIQGNMAALNKEGKEGALRARYVRDLETTEEKLVALQTRETELKNAVLQTEQEIKQKIAAL